MATRILVCVVSAILIVISGSLCAQEADSILEIKRLQNLLSVVNAEFKSDLDQILILQKVIRDNSRVPLEAQQGRSPDPIMLDDVAAEQRLAIKRETALNARLEALLVRSGELDAIKLPILERIRELSLAPPVPAARPASTRK